MSVENTIVNKSDHDSGLERKKKILESLIENRIRWYIDQIVEENPTTSQNTKTYLEGLSRFIKKIEEILPDKKADLGELFNFFVTSPIEDGEEFVRRITDKMTKFLLANLGFDEIENIVRRGKTMLNRLVEYDIGNDVVNIHVPATFLENPIELRSLLVDAMKKLAEKIKHDPEFKDISKVVAKSWIVLKSHKVLEKQFGFTIVSLEPQNNVGTAEISKEKLITMWGRES